MAKVLQFAVLFLLSISNNLAAQQIDAAMRNYAEHFVPEKVHLQFDRSVYNKGETIYYKAYLLEDHDLSSLSKNFYVDWYDEAGKIVQQTEAPLLLSSAKGSFSVPQNYEGKVIYLKAYTKWMLNFDTAFIYSRSIAIWQRAIKKEGFDNNMSKSSSSTPVQLYPEGGFAVAGLINRFAFKAVDPLGYPVEVKGFIKNSKGQLLDSVATLHDGMGIFSLLTEPGQNYFFEWEDTRGKVGIAEIMAQKQSGACLRVSPANKKALFSVERTVNAGREFKTMHLLIHRNLTLRYKLDINLSSKLVINSEIALDDLPTGIVQFTLFNADWTPVAERIIFVDNQNHSFYPEITVTKKDLSKKGKNEIKISVPDTLLTNMSVAVTEAGVTDLEGPTIFSDFLLSNEIKGKVNNPGYYFSKDIKYDTSIQQGQPQAGKTNSVLASHLDLLMLTQGHRRFDWDKITKGLLPVIQYPAETDYLKIKGHLTVKKLLKSKDPLLLNVILNTKDSTKSMLVIPIQADGSFEQKPIFYDDTAQLFYSLSGKRSINKMGTVKFENGLLADDVRKQFFLTQQIASGAVLSFLKDESIGNPEKQVGSFFSEQENFVKMRASETLKEVVVHAKVKTRKQILDDYYTSGLYSGEDNNYTVDVEGDINASGYRDIFAYLQTKIPGLKVEYIRPSPEPIPVWFPDSNGIPSQPALLLDEVPISLSSVSGIDVTSIAYVKAFRPPFLGSMLNGFSGVIALYSKKGYSPIQEKQNGEGLESALLSGYTKFKEFIQPNYNDSKVREEGDYRPSLYWNPFILTDKYNQHTTIEFYNNDISRKLCIVLEGINAEGKMTRVVKLLE
ncbi:MAG: hypothetical protein JWM28_4131 [Chitinophagaceae bacterium]|nr:hypothetical protein [Chitinophagaceae bacterium]